VKMAYVLHRYNPPLHPSQEGTYEMCIRTDSGKTLTIKMIMR